MARVVFFSFDYDDVWRVNQVRNSWVTLGEQRAGFKDKAEYEQVKRSGDRAIKNWIRKQIHGCSVTCVLIGGETNNSEWVHYEIRESIANGMGLVGVYIHKLKDQVGNSVAWFFDPPNPLEKHKLPPRNDWERMFPSRASDHFETHTWVPAESLFGRTSGNDLGGWVEEAARRAGR